MQLSEYFTFPEEHILSATEAQALNAVLSDATAQAIPKDKRERVLDYLSAALLVGSVDKFHRSGVERLISELNNIPSV